MADKSLDSMNTFLDWTAEKGLMAKNTVGGRKAAVNAVLGVLDPEEKGDVTVIDLDDVMTRFINLNSKKYNTSSLNVYKSRTNAAISDFQRWLNDPLAFKPQGNKTERRPSQKEHRPARESRARVEASDQQSSPPAPAPASANVFPIPIREDVVVRIIGLPFDLTSTEAEKIANVVKAMAVPSN